jgi:cytochrome P450
MFCDVSIILRGMDFAAPAALRSRLGAWAGRRFVKRLRKKGIDASTLALLPDSILTQFTRDGLDPVPGARPAEGGPGMVKESLPFGMDAWVVTGYDENRQILGAGSEFSNDFTRMAGAEAAGVQDRHPGGLGIADPPDHTRLRRILTPEFTVRRLRRLGPLIEGIVEDQLDGIAKAAAASSEPVDLVSLFAWPIPSLTICELLGVSPEDRDEFQRLSTERFDLSTGLDAALGSISTSLSHLEKIVETQRKDPGDGLLGMIVRDHGDTVSDEELVGLADGVLTGGLETSASMLALGSLVLLQTPQIAAAVREDDSVVDGLVEELLRYLSVVQMAFPRFARRDIEINGHQVKEGDIVLCSLLQANRSEELTRGAGLFDAARAKNSHLAFGHGIHRCVGAELARMELRAAYPALLRRFPEMQLAVPSSALDFRKLSIVYGLDTLPVTLG